MLFTFKLDGEGIKRKFNINEIGYHDECDLFLSEGKCEVYIKFQLDDETLDVHYLDGKTHHSDDIVTIKNRQVFGIGNNLRKYYDVPEKYPKIKVICQYYVEFQIVSGMRPDGSNGYRLKTTFFSKFQLLQDEYKLDNIMFIDVISVQDEKIVYYKKPKSTFGGYLFENNEISSRSIKGDTKQNYIIRFCITVEDNLHDGESETFQFKNGMDVQLKIGSIGWYSALKARITDTKKDGKFKIEFTPYSQIGLLNVTVSAKDFLIIREHLEKNNFIIQ